MGNTAPFDNGDTWVLDSGASQHMTGDARKLFHNDGTVPKVSVKVADGTEHNAVGHGNALVEAGFPGGTTVLLQDVLLVPFDVSLISISQITKRGVVAIFKDDVCELVKDGKLLLRGIRCNGNTVDVC